MSYESTLEYIQNVKWVGSKLGLSRTRELLASLGNPEKKLKFVHIGGTNGKGSTAACIASILQKAGYKTGLYTSPYLYRFNERMQINGEQISDAELEELTDKIRPFADSMTDVPTEFELITALAMEYFAKNEADIVVLEVGLGGALDSTNVIDTPEAAVITPIGLDHTEYLGDTTAKIAETKSGIIKPGGHVAVYSGENDVMDVIRSRCREVGAELRIVENDKITVHSIDLDACRFDYKSYKGIALPLVGTYQPYNAALAITACEILQDNGWKITAENIIEGLNSVKWPGRFEVLRKNPTFILDGAHNPHGIAATAKSLKEHFKDQKLTFVIGVMADKDVAGMMNTIAPLAKDFITVTPDNPRAMDAKELAGIIEKTGKPVTACSTIPEGVDLAISRAGKDGAVVALGSLYFSGDIRNAVLGR